MNSLLGSKTKARAKGSVLPHLLLTVVAIGMLAWSARWGLAGLYSIPAERVGEAWQHPKHPQPPDKQNWEKAVTYLHQAIKLEPNNAGHHFRLAHLFHLRALELHSWHPQFLPLLEQAGKEYQQALKLRPSWGFGWINLAQIQVQENRITPETIRFLNRGLRLAPTSILVQRTALHLGFSLWEHLQPTEQQEILLIAKKLLPDHGEYVLTQAKLYGRLTQMRPLVANLPKWQSRLLKFEQNKEGSHG